MERDPFDLEKLRVDPGDLAKLQPKPTKSKKWQRRFIQVPWAWIERLQSTQRASTYRLAMLLLYAAWRSGGRAVVLSNVLFEAEGLSARSKWRALAELEGLGLVQVERHAGRSPRVVLQHTGRS
jgi:hypothetical protein